MKNIIQTINNSNKIALFSHVNPDWDAIWSCLALSGLLNNMWKKSDIFLESKADIFNFLPWFWNIKTEFKNNNYDLIVICDCGHISRVDPFYQQNLTFFESTPILVIDHHIAPTEWFGTNTKLLFEDSKQSSTCWYIFDLLYKDFKEYFDKNIATNLFFGIYTDTGWFIHEEDSIRVFDMCSTLFKLWADKPLIIDKFVKWKSLQETKFLWEIINRTKYEWKILYTYYDVDELILNKLEKKPKIWYDLLSKIDWPNALVIAKKDGEKIRFWMRSKWTHNVQKIADHFGGWWHKYAAWFSIKLDEKENYKNKIIEIVKQIDNLMST